MMSNDSLPEKVNTSGFYLEEIKKKIAPIAEKHRLRGVYVFGSYARNEATDDSDIDLLIDREDSEIHGIFGMSALLREFREALGKEIDLVTLQSLMQKSTVSTHSDFIESVMRERIRIYG